MRRFLKGYRGVSVLPEDILGMKALRVRLEAMPDIRPAALKKRIHLAASVLRRQGIRKLCFKESFPYKEPSLWESFIEMDSVFLYETMAGQIASRISGDGEKTAAFFARRVLEREEKALLSLCRNYRYILVSIETGGPGVCSNIRRKFGISVVERPTERQLLGADTALFFSPPRQVTILSDECVAIAVSGTNLKNVKYNKSITGATFKISGISHNSIPTGFPPEPLISEAMLRNKVRADNISIHHVEIYGARSPYTAGSLDKKP